MNIKIGIIKVLSGSMAGMEFPVQDGETLYLGKDPKLVNIVFDNVYTNLSRMHCGVTYNAKEHNFYVEDYSSNGTFTKTGKFVKSKKTAVACNTEIYLASQAVAIVLIEKDAPVQMQVDKSVLSAVPIEAPVHSSTDAANATMVYVDDTEVKQSSIITIFDGTETPYTVNLSTYNKNCVYFGRNTTNDLVLKSTFVSGDHGRFVLENGKWRIEDRSVYSAEGSTNGIIYNNHNIEHHTIAAGDFIRIDKAVETISLGVLFVFSSENTDNLWNDIALENKSKIVIGRDQGCDIVLPHVSVSKNHAIIVKEKDCYYISDNGSTNGVLVNNKRVTGKTRLHEKDVITITNSKLIFTSRRIFYYCYKSGIAVDVNGTVIKRGKGSKSFITCNHVSFNVRPGELVAIIGGSGAGKSTILNAMCGYLKPCEGEVYINGTNLYQNFDAMKKLFGYVPQSDIVYDNLKLHDMLMYTAKLRLPKDTPKEELERAIDAAIETVDLAEKKNSFIKALSGGQKKRASIAVELLSDPNLLFLDEPASGLDPGTERHLMQSLRRMANAGKTVVLVTHSTLQLKMCDKIVFMGKGGNLCFYGSYDDALKFFNVSDIVDVYAMITDNAEYWSTKYKNSLRSNKKISDSDFEGSKTKKNRIRQFAVLSARYFKLVVNDVQRLSLLLAQAPLLAVLISFVADGEQFEQYEMTKSLLFALSCSGFWVGMLNAIQEICKERTIVKREYMVGLSLSSYISSKIVVLGSLCFIQSILIVGVFGLMVGMPEEGIIMAPFFELFITTFLTAIASTAMGLFVSSLFNNADRAMTVAPILLMPQILFSGLIFKLSGATEIVSWLAVCRWSMEGYGTTANLNDLTLKLQQEGVLIPHEFESFFDYKVSHLLESWGILLAFTVIFLALSRLMLITIGKEKS